jgi:hypothetical protein
MSEVVIMKKPSIHICMIFLFVLVHGPRF